MSDTPTSEESLNTALSKVRDWYSELYSPTLLDLPAMDFLLTDIPRLNQNDSAKLSHSISEQEIVNTIKSLPNGKSPGPDSLPYEFYKHFKHYLVKPLYKMFNLILTLGHTPRSWSTSHIILLPKKGNLSDPANWRPISLVNADSKIFMKIMANRTSKACKKIIGSYQSGFISGRHITDSALNITTAMTWPRQSSSFGWFVFLDQKKAFDRVDHKYLERTLHAFNFPQTYINIVKAIYGHQSSYIVDDGRISTPFNIRRGVRQGDPLSPLLYIISFEPLLRLLNRKLHGIALPGIGNFKLEAYADDLTLGISSIADWHQTLH